LECVLFFFQYAALSLRKGMSLNGGDLLGTGKVTKSVDNGA
jgi:hypothetical protein